MTGVVVVRGVLMPVVVQVGRGRHSVSRYDTVDISFHVTCGRFCAVTPHDAATAPAHCPHCSAPPSAEGVTYVDGGGCVAVAGLVNSHTHSSEHWLRGSIAMLPLELWLQPLFTASATISPSHVFTSAQATGVEALLSGCTSVVDHLYIPFGRSDFLAAAVNAYKSAGIRAFLAPMCTDLTCPTVCVPSFPRGAAAAAAASTNTATLRPICSPEELLAFLETLVVQFHRPKEGINIVIGPTGIQWGSTKFLAGCVALANKYSLPLHTHLLETSFQKQLASTGLLSPPTPTSSSELGST
eukprot:TRINITY_DN27197_c0_g1_i1.p1 TRINITY_DN27197_c0_g1~~TRINITY_DN27197_c0_g1_i1.p1  ORF type:complete len:313 (-),score=82.50 TRINITY_DN27197_c0_g1_i1:54-947(-)